MSPLRRLLTLLSLSLAIVCPLYADTPAAPVEIQEGDRVLLLGDTLLERENTYGFLETRMIEQFRDYHFTVRNLSWSGDTPLGVSRAMFDPPAKGWERLKEQIALVKPTVVFLGYGMAASLQEISDRSGDISFNPDPARYGHDPMTADRFKKELGQLMDAIADLNRSASPNAAAVRFVLLSPIPHEDLSATRPGLPNPMAHNELLKDYTKAISDLAGERQARFVSLQNLFPANAPAAKNSELTTNGIHLGDRGYQALAGYLGHQLGWSSPSENTAASASQPSPLREAVIRKNQLFFHRFRPENWTYLFGFRKHEQGKNAVEIPEFDPLIAHEEEEIEQLKKAAPASAPTVAVSTAPAAPVPPDTIPESPKFDIEQGFKIDLWATNPLLEKPIEMNWDSDGRLWIASSNTYPQVNPEDVAASLASDASKAKKDAPSAGNDKILIIEDPDHTGKATKSTVFAEGLLIPTGVAPFRDPSGQWGCYVGASTELVQLVDTKGAGHADQRKIILSGFGTEDTHHIVHTLRWGPDGRLYFNQSIYIHSHFETPWGMVRLNSGGVLAWDPRTERVEVLYKGFCNPWGHVWDEHGEEFVTDGAGGEGIAWGVLGGMYFTYENGRRILQSVSPGSYPKFCSLEMIHSPLFPEDWQGSFITNDFRAHRIVHFGISDLAKTANPADAKSGYITKEAPDLVRTSDLSFRPIDVKLGPDGALYVADWSNPVINHGEVDFRDPRRDHHHGRIWRISLADKQPLSWEKLTSLQNSDLLAKLKSPSAWEKDEARTVLNQNAADGAALAGKESSAPAGSEPDLHVRAIEARQAGAALFKTLEAQKRLAPTAPETDRALLKDSANQLFAKCKSAVTDPNPRVRVEGMRALARIQTPESASLILDAALNAPSNDPYYDYAAWLSINDLSEPWARAVMSGQWKVEGHEKQLEFALNSIDPAYGQQVLTKVIGSQGIPADGGPWVELIGKTGSPAELRKLFDALTGQHLTPAAAERAIAALAEAARIRNARPDGDLAGIASLLSNHDLRISTPAARLVGAWKLGNGRELLVQIASGKDAQTPSALRVAAIDGLREIGGAPALSALRALTRAGQADDIRQHALIAVTQLDLEAGIAAAGEVLPTLTNADTALATWRALMQIRAAPETFAKHLPANLPPTIAAAGLRAAREAGKKGEALAKLLAESGGAQDTTLAPHDYKKLAELTKRDGDPARGEMIFRRPQLACLTCHAIGGAGGKVGPELTSLGASAPLDYIIESVLVPNAKVKEGFNAVSLTLKDGTVATGIQTRETAQEFFLRNVVGQETGVPKANVVSRENIGSIMPAGLADPLSDLERSDLYAFLAQLGKPGAYDASKGNVARYWALYPGAEQNKVLTNSSAATPAAGYTLVDGRLTPELLQRELQLLPNAGDFVIAVAKFQVPTAGYTTLKFEGVLEAWLDGRSTVPAGRSTTDLAAGEHVLAIKLNPKLLPDNTVRVECEEGRFIGN